MKVYILAGQSNMVGIGQASPAESSRYDTFQTAEKNAEGGCVVSIYKGAYDPSIDYGKQEAVETHVVNVGSWTRQSDEGVLCLNTEI